MRKRKDHLSGLINFVVVELFTNSKACKNSDVAITISAI